MRFGHRREDLHINQAPRQAPSMTESKQLHFHWGLRVLLQDPRGLPKVWGMRWTINLTDVWFVMLVSGSLSLCVFLSRRLSRIIPFLILLHAIFYNTQKNKTPFCGCFCGVGFIHKINDKVQHFFQCAAFSAAFNNLFPPSFMWRTDI